MPKARFASLAAIKRQLPAATPTAKPKSKGKGAGAQLMLTVPQSVAVALRVKAGETGSTVRALVLQALSKAGYPVPADELRDRRRHD
jgi:hypothetical protein